MFWWVIYCELPKNESLFFTLTENPEGESIERVFENIENPGSWIALYDVESDLLYKEFIDSILNSIKADSKLYDPSIFSASGYIFISSPPRRLSEN